MQESSFLRTMLNHNFPASRGSFLGVRFKGEKKPLPWIENDYIEHAHGLATEPSHVMFVTRDENKTFHLNIYSNIDKPRLGRAIRPTSSLGNVISPQQFLSTDCPSLKRSSWIGCFPRFPESKVLRHF